ncbi:MAG: hypothetical protein QW343_03140 [Candidatus Norongarragalinales archaeon]
MFSRMKRRFSLIFVFVFIAVFALHALFFSSSANALQADALVNVGETSNFFLTSFSITPSEVIEGASADFSVTVENRGNVEDTLSVNVSILDAGGVEVYVINYTPVNVTPGAISTLTTTWSSAGFARGAYSAKATGVYNASNYTNSLTANFSIISPAALPQFVGGGVTPTPSLGTPTALPVLPTTIPQRLFPRPGVVFFSRKTVLQEVLAGESALLSLTIENEGGEAVSARIVFSGLPDAATQLSPKKIFLQPHAASTIDFAVWVKENAIAGDYVVKISVIDEITQDEIATEFFFLRVKNYPKNYENPFVMRRISLDLKTNSSDIVLSVRNPSKRVIDVIDVLDAIPSPLAATQNDVLFLDKIGSFLSFEPLTLAWRLTNVEPEEKSVLSYSVKTLSRDYSVYGTWYAKQIATTRQVRLSDLVTITEFNIQNIEAGGRSKASFTVFYGGLAPILVTASLALPAQFKSTPQSFANVVLAPRTTQEFDFQIEADERTDLGAYSARAIVNALNDEVVSVGAIMVLPRGFALAFSPYLVLALLAAIIILALFVQCRREKTFYNRERIAYGNSLRRIIFGKEEA